MHSIPKLKSFHLLLGATAVAILLLVSCSTEESWVILPNLSPPVEAVDGHPMKRAEEVAKGIPNSYVMVAHGSARFALYPSGTVLIIQKIDWSNLRPGMTAIYYIDEGLTAAMTGGLLTRKQDDAWRVPRMEAWRRPGTGAHEHVDLITHSRYEGVVVAAFLGKEDYDPQLMLRYPPREMAGSCVLRCHLPVPR